MLKEIEVRFYVHKWVTRKIRNEWCWPVNEVTTNYEKKLGFFFEFCKNYISFLEDKSKFVWAEADFRGVLAVWRLLGRDLSAFLAGTGLSTCFRSNELTFMKQKYY